MKIVSRIVLEGGFFGSAQNIWGNPYLNSTTVLFDAFMLFLFQLITLIRHILNQHCTDYQNLILLSLSICNTLYGFGIQNRIPDNHSNGY